MADKFLTPDPAEQEVNERVAKGKPAYGSPEHLALLALAYGRPLTAEEKKAAAKPPVPSAPNKRPVNSAFYRSGDEVIDGWRKRSDN